jgi:hypothetical protein
MTIQKWIKNNWLYLLIVISIPLMIALIPIFIWCARNVIEYIFDKWFYMPCLPCGVL